MKASRHAAAALTALVPFLVFGGPAAADPMRIAVEPGAFESADALTRHVQATLRGAPAEILGVDPAGGIVLLDGGEAAALALRSDPIVLRVDFEPPQPSRTRIVLIEITQDGVSAEAFHRSARSDAVMDGPTGWPGEVIQVDALAADGEVLETIFVRDWRFVRYEGWNADGSHEAGSNQSFVDETIPLEVRVAIPAEATSVRVFDRLDMPGEPEGRRSRGRLQITEGEGSE